jgi:hypothetical protein
VLVDDLAGLGLQLRGLRGGAVGVEGRCGRNVLPHQQPEPVGVVVPARGLHLDVFAHHVEAQVLVLLQVGGEGGVGGRGVEAVRPEALIKGADLEDELTVQGGAHNPVDLLRADLAHAEVAGDAVDNVAGGVAQGDPKVVQERVVG